MLEHLERIHRQQGEMNAKLDILLEHRFDMQRRVRKLEMRSWLVAGIVAVILFGYELWRSRHG